MDFKTDYVRQQVKDERLQDLLIKSRARNKYSPVQYQGRTYWCLEELTKEKELEYMIDSYAKIAERNKRDLENAYKKISSEAYFFHFSPYKKWLFD